MIKEHSFYRKIIYTLGNFPVMVILFFFAFHHFVLCSIVFIILLSVHFSLFCFFVFMYQLILSGSLQVRTNTNTAELSRKWTPKEEICETSLCKCNLLNRQIIEYRCWVNARGCMSILHSMKNSELWLLNLSYKMYL